MSCTLFTVFSGNYTQSITFCTTINFRFYALVNLKVSMIFTNNLSCFWFRAHYVQLSKGNYEHIIILNVLTIVCTMPKFQHLCMVSSKVSMISISLWSVIWMPCTLYATGSYARIFGKSLKYQLAFLLRQNFFFYLHDSAAMWVVIKALRVLFWCFALSAQLYTAISAQIFGKISNCQPMCQLLYNYTGSKFQLAASVLKLISFLEAFRVVFLYRCCALSAYFFTIFSVKC